LSNLFPGTNSLDTVLRGKGTLVSLTVCSQSAVAGGQKNGPKVLALLDVQTKNSHMYKGMMVFPVNPGAVNITGAQASLAE
jgi:hypothetical protein